jgi:hypothetical protein
MRGVVRACLRAGTSSNIALAATLPPVTRDRAVPSGQSIGLVAPTFLTQSGGQLAHVISTPPPPTPGDR